MCHVPVFTTNEIWQYDVFFYIINGVILISQRTKASVVTAHELGIVLIAATLH